MRQRKLGSGPDEQDEVARRARHARLVDLDRRPLRSRACRPSTSWTAGASPGSRRTPPGRSARSAWRSSEAPKNEQRGGGGLAGVVPALEGADQRRGPQAVGPASPRRSGCIGGTVAPVRAALRHHRSVAAIPTPPGRRPTIATLRAGDEVDGVFACTRKDRLIARAGTPYLALELRDRTGAMPGRAFRDADVLAGALRARRPRARRRPRRALPRRAAGRRARDRARRGRGRPGRVPAGRLPRPRRARRLPRAPRARGPRPGLRARCSTRCSATTRCAPPGAARRARAAATTPTSAGCSSTPSRSARSRSRPACCTRG